MLNRRPFSHLIIIAAIALTMLLGATHALAANGVAGDSIIWNISKEGVLTISGNGKMDKSENWSSYRRDITSVEIGEGITTLSDDAFYGCDKIKFISLPSTMTKIGDRAFYGCKDLESIFIPASVTKIGDYALSNTGLTSVVIEEGATEVWSDAFYGCDKLTSVVIPSTIRKIGDRAFYGCKKLTTLSIPAGVKSIGDYALSNSGLETVIIADGVTEIWADAFYGCDKLQNIIIPSTVTEIDDRAFYGCKKLKRLIIPSGIDDIGDFVFSSSGLEEVIFTNGTNEIPDEMFYGCDKLERVLIPASVSEIGDLAFYGCKSLETIYYSGSEKDWLSIDVGDYNNPLNIVSKICNYTDDDFPKREDAAAINSADTTSTETAQDAPTVNERPDIQTGNFVDGGTSGSITWTFDSNGLLTLSGTGEIDDEGSWRFYRSSIKSVIIEDGIEKIGENAFKSYNELSYIYIPNTVTKIGDRAFYYCTSLESITIPASVTNMGEFIFCGSTLKTVTFQEGATIISENAFRSSEYLESVVLPNTITTIEDRAFYYCTSLESITIPASVTDMGEFIFCGSTLKTVTFQEGATIIGENAFRSSEYLENVVLPNTITTIEDRAFYFCTNLKEITLPNSISSWGEFIFSGSALETVTFREGLQLIGENAFRNADKLKTVNLPNTLIEIEDRAFYVTEDLEEITIPANLKKMGEFIFYGSGLKKVIIAEGATTVYEEAFNACDHLEEVYLPSTITEIQDRAFYGCDNLKSIVIPASLKEVGDYVFYGSALETIYFCGSPAEWNSINIQNNYVINSAQIFFNYIPEEAIVNCSEEENSSISNATAMSTEFIVMPVSTATVEPIMSQTTSFDEWDCPNCGEHTSGNFCNHCGTKRLPTDVGATSEPTAEQSSRTETFIVKLNDGTEVLVRKSVKEVMDAYETFIDEYKDAMKRMSNGDFSESMIVMEKYTELEEKLNNMDDLTEGEELYCFEVSTRILQKMNE